MADRSFKDQSEEVRYWLTLAKRKREFREGKRGSVAGVYNMHQLIRLGCDLHSNISPSEMIDVDLDVELTLKAMKPAHAAVIIFRLGGRGKGAEVAWETIERRTGLPVGTAKAVLKIAVPLFLELIDARMHPAIVAEVRSNVRPTYHLATA